MEVLCWRLWDAESIRMWRLQQQKIVKVVDTVTPEPELTRKYEERYQYFRRVDRL